MSRNSKKAKKRIRKTAAVLALVLFVSELPVMPLSAAQEEEIELSDKGGEEPDAGNTAGAEPERNIESLEIPEETENEQTGPDMEKAGAGMEETGDTGEADSAGEAEGIKESMAENMLTDEEIATQKAMEPAHLPALEREELPDHYVAAEDYSNPYRSRRSLEAVYDFRDSGFLTRVKNQNPWGTCWAFAAIAGLEASLVQQGFASAKDVDLSENHLAYFVANTGFDRLGNANGDTVVTSNDEYYLNCGGSVGQSALRLMNWQGIAAESKYPYPRVSPAPIAREYAQDAAWHLRNCFLLDTKPNDSETVQNVKAMIQRYGCIQWTYWNDSDFMNYHTKAYYKDHYTEEEVTNKATTNHVITVVGWDDDFSRTKFLTQPKEDGAWIVRNSWGDGWGDDGYFYISYEDVSLGSGSSASAVIADSANDYDNNYFYSNTIGNFSTSCHGKAAQVYQIKGLSSGREQIKAVSFMIAGHNTDYKIQLYKNPKLENGVVQDPESGVPMLDTEITGRTSYAGLYTVDLPVPVTLDAEEQVAVVIYFPDKDGIMFCNTSGKSVRDLGTIEWHNEVSPGQSFLLSQKNGSWEDLCGRGRSLRINLLTDNVDDEGNIRDLGLKATVQQPTDFYDTYKINLRWGRSDFVTGYEIYRSPSAGGDNVYEKLAETAWSNRQYTDEAGQAGAGEYTYKIRALFSDGTCQDSLPVTIRLEGGIEFGLLKTVFDGKTVRLTWNGTKGAAGYEIQRKEEKEAEYTELARITDPSVLTYEDSLEGQDKGCWQYRIRAYDENGHYTGWSEERQVTKVLKITQVNHKTLRFSWPPAEGADVYSMRIVINGAGFGYLYRNTSVSIDIEDWLRKLKEDPNNAQYNIPDFHVGDTYSYYMVPKDTNGAKMEEFATSVVTFRTVPDDLSLDSLLPEGGGVKLAWSGGGGADTVRIYRSESPDGDGVVCSEVPADEESFTDTADIRKGVTYYYRIQPTVQNSQGETVEGNSSGYKAVTVPQIEKDTYFTSVTAVSDTEVSLAWEKNPAADGYILYRSSRRGETGQVLAEITGRDVTAYKDTGLAAGEILYYNIRAYVLQGQDKVPGALSVQRKARTLPDETHIKEPVLTEESVVRVEWEKVRGAEGYIVERHMEAEDFATAARIKGGDTVFWEDTEVLDGHICTYRVKAFNMLDGSRMQCGKLSVEKTFTMPVGKVQELKAVYKDGMAELTWTEAFGAKEYRVCVKAGQGEYTELGTTGECRYVWNGVQPANVYTFRVTAAGQDGTESRQEAVCELCVLPNLVMITSIRAVNEKKIRINWELMEGASYDLYRRDDQSKYALLREGLTENFYEDEEIITGKTYSYKVVACKNGLKSDLAQTYRKKGQTRPDKAELTDTGISWITIRNNPEYEYAIGTVSQNTEGLVFAGSMEDTVTFGGLTPDRMYYITARTKQEVTGEAPVYGEELAAKTVSEGLWIAGNVTHVYTGKAVTPQVRVYVGMQRLKKGTDYTVSYKNNVKAKDASAGGKVPSVIIKGRKKYAGLKGTYTFSILPKDIGDGITCNLVDSCVYSSKKAPQVRFSMKYGSKSLKKGRDYTISYEDDKGNAAAWPDRAADYTLVIKGMGNYTGEQRHVLHVLDESRVPMSRVKAAKIGSVSWDGEAKTPSVAVKYKSAPLVPGTDFEVTYRNNTAAGTAYADIKGKGVYAGTKTVSFRIKGTSLKKVSVKGFRPIVDYTGEAVIQPSMRLVMKKGGQELAEGRDYTVSYANHTEAGKASVVITGIGGYTGTIKKTFWIR